jgi:hypothetical protein
MTISNIEFQFYNLTISSLRIYESMQGEITNLHL